MEESDSSEYPVWRYPVRNTGLGQSDHITSIVTSVDAFFVGMGLGFLDTAMIEESLVLFPVTVLEAVIGIFAGYRLGLKENRRAYWIGGALLLLASFDVILHYYM